MKTTILECVVGSTLHGTSVSDGLEDLDLMAVVVEDLKTFAGFNACDTWTSRTKPMGVRSEAGDVDYVAYGLRKYLHLALKGNPSILLALFAGDEHTREITDAGRSLRALAPKIISKQCYMPFRGYMRQQHERLLGLRGQRNVTRPELVERYGFDTKYAAHVVRLGLQGRELLTTGRLSLPMRDDERALCVKVRTGGFSLAEVSEQIIAAERALDEAFATSPLPDRPQTEVVEAWMLKTYASFWSGIAWSKGERETADAALAEHRERLAAAGVAVDAPTEQQAYDLGAKGAPATERERLLFEAWMHGHCWALCATWDGKQYRSDAEQGGALDPHAMATRQLFAAWRDRAALGVAGALNDQPKGGA